MYCTESITQKSFQDFLNKTIIDKDSLQKYSSLFEIMKSTTDLEANYEKINKVLFLLYNEYISIYDNSLDLNNINNLLNSELYNIDYSYAFVKTYFLRDLLVTLTFDHYKDTQNILDQLDICDSLLTAEEQNYIATYFNDGHYCRHFARYQRTINTKIIMFADCEMVTSTLYNISKDLNDRTSENSELLKSILNKIMISTIHY